MNDSQRRILVLGLCRNCSTSLPVLLASFEAIARDEAMKIQVFLGENGSTDRTLEILAEAAAANPWLHLIDTNFMADIPERLARMAAGREALRKCLPTALPGDAVLVLDLDIELIRPLSTDLLFAALGELDEDMTNGICSYSQPVHYDILALRETPKSNNPVIDLISSTVRPRSFIVRLLRFLIILFHVYRISRKQRVLGKASGRAFVSAFNGLCLYHRPLYDEVSYLSPNLECEHVTLHLAMHDKTRGLIRVSQHLGVIAPTEHIASVAGKVKASMLSFLNVKDWK